MIWLSFQKEQLLKYDIINDNAALTLADIIYNKNRVKTYFKNNKHSLLKT